MIEAEGLSMSYGDLLALDSLELSVQQGEFFAFLGPNAAGKTTTIKLMTGLLKPTRGRASICGYDVQRQPLEAKRRLGYVPDVAVFYEKLTPLDFMSFTAELFEVERSRAKSATAELFEKFELGVYANELVENLSHGTRQRLAIAAALMHDPEVVIIDEPMVGLDPIHARVVKEELKRRSRAGTTIFMSTHLLNIAEELADRIGIVHHGKLVALGTLAELRRDREGESKLEQIFMELVADPSGELAGGGLRH